ncbi:LacI family DNA-binding transcriptional regulator [Actinokineospora sp. 24-640]
MKRPHRVTIDRVAAESRVSRQTVSNVLNYPERVAPDTLRRVRLAIERLGYQPDRSARTMVRRRAGQVGYCLSPNSTGFMDDFLRALCAAVEASGSHLLLFTAPEGEAGLAVYADLIAQRAVDGFVCAHVVDDDPRPAWLHERGVPFAMFGRTWSSGPRPGPQPGPWVDVDGAGAAAALVAGLRELGHSRIAFLDWAGATGAMLDRGRGCAEACRAAGLPPPLAVRAEEYDSASAERAVRAALAAEDAPTAVVAASDILAVGAVHAAYAAGLRVGEDLAVTGFDDSVVAPLCPPGLTSVRQPVEVITAALVERLRDQDAGGLLVQGEVVVRLSAPIATR